MRDKSALCSAFISTGSRRVVVQTMSKPPGQQHRCESHSTGMTTAGPGPDSMAIRARVLMRQGELKQAEVLARQALSRSPRDPGALYVMGLVLSRKGDPSGAIDFYERAIEMNGGRAPYHCELGNAYLDSKPSRPIEAAREFRQALLLKPGSALARLGLGLALMAQTDYGAAASELETVARLRPSRADVHRYLGITLIENKRIDEEIAHLSRAIELEPSCPVATLKLGIALRINGH